MIEPHQGKPNLSVFWLIVVMSLISMIGPFAIDTYLPAFPTLEAEFSVSRALLSQSLAFYLAAFAIATLFWGPITDRFGRKKIILSSMLLYILASLGCALVQDYNQFLLFRLIQGAAVSGSTVAGRAMIRDIFDSKEAQRVMSYSIIFFAFAPALAPIIGAWLHDSYGWRSIFYFLALWGVIATALIVAIVYESLPHSKRQSLHPIKVGRVYLSMLKNTQFQAIILANGMSFGGFFIFIAGSPTIIFDFLKLEANDYWMQFVPMVLGLIIGAFSSGRLSYHCSAKTMINIAFFAWSIAVTLNVLQAYFLPTAILGVVSPLVLYAFGIGLALPTFTIMALDCFPDNRGSAAAVQSFVQMMSNALVASLIIPLVNHSLIAFVLAQTVFVIIALLFWIKVIYARV